MSITKLSSAACAAALCAIGACSTTDENETADGSTDLFPGDGGGGSSTGAGANGSGGSDVFPGGGSGGEGSTGGAGEEPCVAVEHESDQAVRPADIIVAIDQSGSMDTETAWVKNQLSSFANQITASGIDVHVVMIAGLPGSENGFCIPAPLGSGGCPDDNNPPTLLHIDQHVGSNDAFARILAAFPAPPP